MIMPIEMARPPKDIRLPEIPNCRMARKVNRDARGSAMMVTNDPGN